MLALLVTGCGAFDVDEVGGSDVDDEIGAWRGWAELEGKIVGTEGDDEAGCGGMWLVAAAAVDVNWARRCAGSWLGSGGGGILVRFMLNGGGVGEACC